MTVKNKDNLLKTANKTMLTAFKGNFNSSKILLDSISIVNPEIHKAELTNSMVSCEKEIKAAISYYKPKLVIAMGQKPDADCIYIETTAHRDNKYLTTNFDVSRLTKSLDTENITYCVSSNAGNYLCNHAFYAGLEFIQQLSLNTKMIFIHIPSVKRFSEYEKVSRWLSNFLSQ